MLFKHVFPMFLFAGWGLGTAEVLTLSNESFQVEVETPRFALRIHDAAKGALLETTGADPVLRFTRVTGQSDPFSSGSSDPWVNAGIVTESSKTQNGIVLQLASVTGGAALMRLELDMLDAHTLRATLIALQPDINRTQIHFGQDEKDRYYGMGERRQGAEHHGKSIYNWAEEGSVKPEATYFPVPYYLNPIRGYGFLLQGTHFSRFDFGAADPSRLQVTHWHDTLSFLVFAGENPLQIMEAYTAHAGRATMVPKPWVFAPWNSASSNKTAGSASGAARTRDIMRKLREGGIPSSAIWNEDWDFGYILQYEGMVKDMHEQGFKALGYRLPYQLFSPPKEYVTLCEGSPCNAFSGFSQVDLTIEAGRKWTKDNSFQSFYNTGGDGWMHDYGEYTPANSMSHDGRDGWAVHNDYPRLWAQVAREFWDERRPDGDFIFFMRSGWTGSWKHAPLAWTGDQATDWSAGGGMPSVLPAAISLSMSGFPLVSTDIGGFLCLLTSPTDRELFYRWSQLGALLPVMRTHNGFWACGDNFLFDKDSSSLAHWKKYAELHTRLFPYIYTLAHQAKDRGWPATRHMVLHYPDAPGPTERQHDQFMLGDRILVAPVVVKGATTREVYLPPGDWIHFWSEESFAGGKVVTVAAPLEEIPLFIKAGTALPLFDLPTIHTLVEDVPEGLNGFEEANATMTIRMYGSGAHEFTLWDGTKIKCNGAECSASGGPARSYTYVKVSPETIAGVEKPFGPALDRTGKHGRSWVVYDLKGRPLELLSGLDSTPPSAHELHRFGAGLYFLKPLDNAGGMPLRVRVP